MNKHHRRKRCCWVTRTDRQSDRQTCLQGASQTWAANKILFTFKVHNKKRAYCQSNGRLFIPKRDHDSTYMQHQTDARTGDSPRVIGPRCDEFAGCTNHHIGCLMPIREYNMIVNFFIQTHIRTIQCAA